MMPDYTQEFTTWDNRFFSLCLLLAGWSEDKSRKVGAVIVGPTNEIRATGFNGLPRGINGAIEIRHSRREGEKYHWYEHAERNAIYNAARAGTPVAGCIMYTNLFPCAECTRGIIQAGIVKLNTRPPPDGDETYARSFDVSIEMLREAGVKVELFDWSRLTLTPPAPS